MNSTKHLYRMKFYKDIGVNMSDPQPTTSTDMIELGDGTKMSREELRAQIQRLKLAQDAEKQVIMEELKPLQSRKSELEGEINKVVGSRKSELEAVEAQKKKLLGEIDEETKEYKADLAEVNKAIEEKNQELEEIGVLEKSAKRRSARATTASGEEKYKSYVGNPQYNKYLEFFKRNPHHASLNDLKKAIRADSEMGGYHNDGLNEAGTGFSGSANYVWIALRKEGQVRWNDDGTIDYVGGASA